MKLSINDTINSDNKQINAEKRKVFLEFGQVIFINNTLEHL